MNKIIKMEPKLSLGKISKKFVILEILKYAFTRIECKHFLYQLNPYSQVYLKENVVYINRNLPSIPFYNDLNLLERKSDLFYL